MKKPLPYYTLILLAALNSSVTYAQSAKSAAPAPGKQVASVKKAAPQTAAQKKAALKQQADDELAKKKAADELAAKKKADDELAAAKKKSEEEAAAKLKASIKDIDISEDEAKSAGLGLSFNGSDVQLTGTLPLTCAKLVNIKGAPSVVDPKEGDADSKISSVSDLDDHSKIVGVKISFTSSDEEDKKSLKVCLDKHAADLDKVELSADDRLTKKSVIAASDIAGAGFDFGKGVGDKKILATSKTYQGMLKILDEKKVADKKKKEKDCVACNIKEMNNVLSFKDSGLDVNAKILALMDKSLKSQEEAIPLAKNKKELEKIRASLALYSDALSKMDIDSDMKAALIVAIGQAFKGLTSQAFTLAMSSGKDAGSYASFISDTYGVFAELPTTSDRQLKQDARQLKADFAKGGEKRVNFISDVDPANPEIVDVLNGGMSSLSRLANDVRRRCGMIMSQNSYNQCTAAKAHYNNVYSNLQTLSLRYMENQNMINTYDGRLQPQYNQGQMLGMNGFSGGSMGMQQNPMSMNSQFMGGGNFQGNSLYNMGSPMMGPQMNNMGMAQNFNGLYNNNSMGWNQNSMMNQGQMMNQNRSNSVAIPIQMPAAQSGWSDLGSNGPSNNSGGGFNFGV